MIMVIGKLGGSSMPASKPFMFDDVEYPSREAAMVALNKSRSTIQRYVKKGYHYSHQIKTPNKLTGAAIEYLQSGADIDIDKCAEKFGVKRDAIYRAMSGTTHNPDNNPRTRKKYTWKKGS